MEKYDTNDIVIIRTTIEKVWDFFENLEDNYLKWHVKDHISLKWIKGKPHTVGSVVKASEYILGRKVTIKMTCIYIKKYHEIRYKTHFPMSLFHPASKYEMKASNGLIEFVATNSFVIPSFGRKRMLALIKDTERHIREEGLILKDILEKDDVK